MGYLSWLNEHAIKHKKIIDKLLASCKTQEEIIDYFDFDNMVNKEVDFCPLYKDNKKCHDMKKLNCYLCSCPDFRFDDTGIKKIEDKTQYSFCSIDSKNGEQGIYGDKIHQDCSGCTIPHIKSYVQKHFDLDWSETMKECKIEE